MVEATSYSEQRLAIIRDDIIVSDLIAVSGGEICTEAGKQVYDRLPRRLTQFESSELGTAIGVVSATERQDLDKEPKIRRAEIQVLGWLGSSAIAYDDPFTTISIAEHLKTLGLHGRAKAFNLAINKRIFSSNDGSVLANKIS